MKETPDWLPVCQSVCPSRRGRSPDCGLVLAATLARGAGGGPSNTDAVPAAGCDGVRESPVGGSGDGDGVLTWGRDVRARGLFRGFVCVFVVCSKCVRTWLAAAICLFIWISLCVYLRVCV